METEPNAQIWAFDVQYRKYLTYKEWKQIPYWPLDREPEEFLSVSTLPIRNGNPGAESNLLLSLSYVSTLPIRNGNGTTFPFLLIFQCGQPCFVSTLPIRNGNCPKNPYRYLKNWKSKYLTYKEWKPNRYILPFIKGVFSTTVSTLPIRNGNRHAAVQKFSADVWIRRKYLTYKEWKLYWLSPFSMVISKTLRSVSTLPIRNGNSVAWCCVRLTILVSTLPIRNGNISNISTWMRYI